MIETLLILQKLDELILVSNHGLSEEVGRVLSQTHLLIILPLENSLFGRLVAILCLVLGFWLFSHLLWLGVFSGWRRYLSLLLLLRLPIRLQELPDLLRLLLQHLTQPAHINTSECPLCDMPHHCIQCVILSFLYASQIPQQTLPMLLVVDIEQDVSIEEGVYACSDLNSVFWILWQQAFNQAVFDSLWDQLIKFDQDLVEVLSVLVLASD